MVGTGEGIVPLLGELFSDKRADKPSSEGGGPSPLLGGGGDGADMAMPVYFVRFKTPRVPTDMALSSVDRATMLSKQGATNRMLSGAAMSIVAFSDSLVHLGNLWLEQMTAFTYVVCLRDVEISHNSLGSSLGSESYNLMHHNRNTNIRAHSVEQ